MAMLALLLFLLLLLLLFLLHQLVVVLFNLGVDFPSKLAPEQASLLLGLLLLEFAHICLLL